MDVLSPNSTRGSITPIARLRRYFTSLGARLAATTTILLLVSAGILFANLTRRDWRIEVADKATAAGMVVDVVATGLSPALDFGDVNDVRHQLEVLRSNEDVTGAAIWDGPDGPPMAEWHRDGMTPVRRTGDEITDDKIKVSRSVTAQSRKVPPQLVVRFSLDRENEALGASRKWLFAFLLGLAIVTAVLMNLVIHLQVVRPLRLLANAARALEEGNSPRYVAAGRRDEIGQLAGAFNKMSHSVVSRHWRLETVVEDTKVDAALRFRKLIEAIPDAIVLSQEGIITYANPAFLRLTGAYMRDTIGKYISSVVSVASVSAGAKVSEVHEEVWAIQDKKLTVETRSLDIAIDGVESNILIARDVTEQRKFQAQLAQSDAELRQAQKMEAVGRLAGGIAHDFNNMLSVILGYASMLIDELPADDDLVEPIQEIKLAAERSADLTRQLLAFSRRQPLETQIVNLNATVDVTVKMAQRLLGEDIDVKTALSSEACTIELEAGQIEQVILNLAVNARDAMPNGGILTVETKIGPLRSKGDGEVPPGRFAILTVADNGTGMDRETQDRIFEPFFTTKEQGKGTGLGLSTVFGIVRQGGGEIHVHSELGKGTSFELYFPLKAPIKEVVTEASAPRSVRRKETILLVEDEERVRKLVVEVLSRKGYSVLAAASAQDALRICGEHGGAIDLLLTDIIMPQMNGNELAKRVIGIRPEMRVLYMSGHTDDIVLRHRSGPQVAFLQKPINPDVLSSKVRGALDSPTLLAG